MNFLGLPLEGIFRSKISFGCKRRNHHHVETLNQLQGMFKMNVMSLGTNPGR